MTTTAFVSFLFLLISLSCSIEQNTVRILSPLSGTILDPRNAANWQIRVEVDHNERQSSGTLIIECDGIECARTPNKFYEMGVPSRWHNGFHNVSAHLVDDVGNRKVSAISHFLVTDIFSEAVQLLDCPSLVYNPDEWSTHEPGDRPPWTWNNYKSCLEELMRLSPTNFEVKFQYGRLLEAEGDWNAAATWYDRARSDGPVEPNVEEMILDKISMMQSLERDRRRQPKCAWKRVQSCRKGMPTTECKVSDDQASHGYASVADDAEDLYLSVVMVTRHDNTQYCQVPRDACLDRLRTSLSILLNQLSNNGLSAHSEVILVEWNPCYLNKRQDEGACDPRQGGYLSLEEVVRDRVEAPAEAAMVRIMLVTEELHEALYNPYDFDLMEFIGKNVAARRARGRFILFTNPDDCLTDAMAALLARRQLRPDVVYNTFRGAVDAPVPLGPASSAVSMARFVARNSYSSEHQPLSVAHKAGRWRRAACKEGEGEGEPMRSWEYGWYHDSAAGDFLLISKRAFQSFRGYPEIPTNIMIDGTAIHAAAAHGYGQLVLAGECVIMHQPHPRSYNTKGSMITLASYESLAQQLLDARTDANIRPDGPDDPARRVWHRWNGVDWGLAYADIPEVLLAPSCQ